MGLSPESRQPIVLAMIVKNEAHVLERCFESVRPLISAAVIVDTGSTDGTQDLARRLIGDLPGGVYERPWRDFGHNRTESLELARTVDAEYALVMDADDVLEWDEDFEFPRLDAAGYTLEIHDASDLRYWRYQLFRQDLPWCYRAVLHEYPECIVDGRPLVGPRLPGLRYRRIHDGARRQAAAETARRDVEVLEKAVRDEPENSRYAFYLANSYREAGQTAKACEWYRRRMTMGGWDEEVFVANLMLGRVLAADPDTIGEGREELARAWLIRQHRAEPLVDLAEAHNRSEQWALGWLAAYSARSIPYPEDDRLFLDRTAYGPRRDLAYAVASAGLGMTTVALDAALSCMRGEDTPEWLREQARAFLEKMANRLANPDDPDNVAAATQRDLIAKFKAAMGESSYRPRPKSDAPGDGGPDAVPTEEDRESAEIDLMATIEPTGVAAVPEAPLAAERGDNQGKKGKKGKKHKKLKKGTRTVKGEAEKGARKKRKRRDA